MLRFRRLYQRFPARDPARIALTIRAIARHLLRISTGIQNRQFAGSVNGFFRRIEVVEESLDFEIPQFNVHTLMIRRHH